MKKLNLTTNCYERGITLIALVITIIVLLILAGVTINLTLGENGIFRVAEKAAKNYKDAEEKELGLLDQFNSNLEEITDFDNLKQYVASEGVNKPKILDGMTPIKFILPTQSNPTGSVDPTTEDDESWYNYEGKQWANAQTQDGSMWVWIPRYAYKINYTNPSDKSKGGTVDVVFLIGSTDNYYDAVGNLQTAKRARTATEIVDTTTGYTVHPAFTNETSIQFANGGWDDELTGIWVAKFEAAYADGDVAEGTRRNSAPVVASSVNYTQKEAWASKLETGEESDSWVAARNYKDGEYVVKIGDTYEWKNGVQTTIKYPTFQPLSYSMNYTSISDAYNISRVLTENNNIYGLKSNNADSHLIKNSEWGAVAYLCKSVYGLETRNIRINNVSLDNDVESVYAVTGCAGIEDDDGIEKTTISEINAGTANIYVWNEENGGLASTTGNMYGVYDMSGGVWDRTAGYVANGHKNLKLFGESMAYIGEVLNTTSTKYKTVYLHDSATDTSEVNYTKNLKIYGDAIIETSAMGDGSTGWNLDYSVFLRKAAPFSRRGGYLWNESGAGISAFHQDDGGANYGRGFRTVLVAI